MNQRKQSECPMERASERVSEAELTLIDELAALFEKSPLSLQEKIVNPALFMRRQELSYLMANYEIFKLVKNVKGSIFYFGVYHGAGFMNFANLSAALEPFNHTREIIGFDTFSGYPKITRDDTTHGKHFRTLVKGGFTSHSKEFLEKLLRQYDQNRPLNHIPKTKLVKGDVCDTLPKYLKENRHTLISLAIFTMNLYEPTKLALQLVWSRMPKEGVVIIHSLNEEYYPGATRAVLETIGPEVSINTFPFAPNLAYIIKK